MNFIQKLFSKSSEPQVQTMPSAPKQTSMPPEEPAKKQYVKPAIDETAIETARKEGKKIVFDLLILDESGSMSSIYQPAITGVNETLQTMREAETENPEQRHFATLVTFDTSHFHHIYNAVTAPKAVDITADQYRPCGGTPLFDAMGKAISEMEQLAKEDDIVLVTVITDGYENASREYDCKAIKALVDRLRSEGWVFSYIGANQDVEKVAMSMSINNFREFESTQEGASDMFQRSSRSRKAFYGKMGKLSKQQLRDEDFFEGWNS